MSEECSAPDARLRELALDASPLALVIVDNSAAVVAVTRAARDLLGLVPGDTGGPLQDLDSHLDQAEKERRPVVVSDAERRLAEGRVQTLEIVVTPIFDDGVHLGSSIAFLDVTAVQSTNEELRATVEALEATNRELQTASEELETMHDELEAIRADLGDGGLDEVGPPGG
jgi:two-component system, chemotaxis family, CheB/CheR fusion protein